MYSATINTEFNSLRGAKNAGKHSAALKSYRLHPVINLPMQINYIQPQAPTPTVKSERQSSSKIWLHVISSTIEESYLQRSLFLSSFALKIAVAYPQHTRNIPVAYRGAIQYCQSASTERPRILIELLLARSLPSSISPRPVHKKGFDYIVLVNPFRY